MKRHTINDLFELKPCIDSIDPQGVWLFRGQADVGWDLIPSMFRGVDELKPPYNAGDAEWIARMERDVYRSFSQLCVRHHSTNDKWEQLCLAQHYGIPTRLLDWTRSPLVAAYFAVANDHGAHAAIWALNVSKYPFPAFLGRVTKQFAHRLEVLNRISQKRGPSFFQEVTTPFTSAADRRGDESLPADELANRDEGFLVILDPPRFDNRIAVQDGLFTLHYSFDDNELVWNHTDHLKEVERREGVDILHQIRVPKNKRKDLQQSLEAANMSYYKLYPDLVGLGYHLNAVRRNDFDSYKKNRS